MNYFSNSVLHRLLLLTVFCPCFSRSSQADDTFSNGCVPQLADTCFKKLIASLDCHGTVICDNPEVFCELFDDSLQCSADIIDGDCLKTNGTDKFDSWYKGLRAVYSYMCHPVGTNGILSKSALNIWFPDFKNTNCWNKKTFVKCVGEMLNIHHVVDMLNTPYDYNECIRMVMAMTSCNVNSQSASCASFHEVFINNLVFIFFSQHKCMDYKATANAVGLSMSPNYLLAIAIVLLYCFEKHGR